MLARMEGLAPWAGFCRLIEAHYPKAGDGRPPILVGPVCARFPNAKNAA